MPQLRTSKEWFEIYRQQNALWIHDGKKELPHALLTSGLHSTGFFNSRLIIENERLLRETAIDLANLLAATCDRFSDIQGVVGPWAGATKLSELLSQEIRRINSKPCMWASPIKQQDGESMVFTDAERAHLAHKNIIMCEDVISTSASVNLAAIAARDAGANILPHVLALVNRTTVEMSHNWKITALIKYPMPTWIADECPWCKQGSEAVRPKENWDLLNGCV